MIKLGNCVEANKTKNFILLKTYFFIFSSTFAVCDSAKSALNECCSLELEM